MSDSLIAIVPAAGVGARAAPDHADAVPKQYRLLRGEPMLRHTVRALLAEPRVTRVFVAVSPSDGWVQAALEGLPRTDWRGCGGSTRAQTVANALAESRLAPDTWVLVHDAARPGLPAPALARLIDGCLKDDVGGLLALPVADTVKRDGGAAHRPASGSPVQIEPPAGAFDDAAPRVAETMDRNGLWLAQTPQMFRAGRLIESLAAAAQKGMAITDEASAIEAAGFAPKLIVGAARNFKVTWPEDFELMEKWL